MVRLDNWDCATLMLTEYAGCIAGPDGCLVKLSDAIKKPWPILSTDPAAPQTVLEPLRVST